jgi:hypothetical protein
VSINTWVQFPTPPPNKEFTMWYDVPRRWCNLIKICGKYNFTKPMIWITHFRMIPYYWRTREYSDIEIAEAWIQMDKDIKRLNDV